MSLKRIVGSVVAGVSLLVAAVWAVISAGSRVEISQRFSDWAEFTWGIAAKAISLVSVPGLVVVFGVAIGLWAWDVPQRMIAKLRGDPNDPKVVEQARKKMVRAQVSQFLTSLYNVNASHTIGDLCELVDVIVNNLRPEPPEQLKLFASDLLLEYRLQLQKLIHPVLDARECSTDAQLLLFLRAWGELFGRYQGLVAYVNIGFRVCEVDPWTRTDYEQWRQRDAAFLDAMRQVEHMEGCTVLAATIKEVGWGQRWRPLKAGSDSGNSRQHGIV